MELLVRNAEGNVPRRHRDYAAKKLSKLSRFFNKATRVEMVHSEQKGKHSLEVTVFADEFKIRGEERDSSLQACIDRVSEKLERRLRRLKHRLIDSHRRRGSKKLPTELAGAQSPPRKSLPKFERTRIPVKPMSPEEAALQMDLVDQPFMPFHDPESGKTSLIYRMRTGGYGIAVLDG